MLSVHVIEREFGADRGDVLLEAVLANLGWELPVGLRLRLASAPTAAVAMGLRRLVELTWGPTWLGRRMLAALCDMQREDGSFDCDPLHTACAIAALGRVMQEPWPTALREQAGRARGRALHALAGLQSWRDPLFVYADDRSTEDRAATAALVLALLAHDTDFRSAVRFANLAGWFERRRSRLAPQVVDLWRLSRRSQRQRRRGHVLSPGCADPHGHGAAAPDSQDTACDAAHPSAGLAAIAA